MEELAFGWHGVQTGLSIPLPVFEYSKKGTAPLQSFLWYQSRKGITAANPTSSSRLFMASTISSQMETTASSTESTLTDLGQLTSRSSSLLPSSGFISSSFRKIHLRPFIPTVPTAFPYAKPTTTPSRLYHACPLSLIYLPHNLCFHRSLKPVCLHHSFHIPCKGPLK